MQKRELFEMPEFAQGEMFFSLKDIISTPETPKMNEPFTVKGKVELLKIPFLAPVWVIATITYPEKWWEEIIPIIGAPEVREMDMAIGGDFEITYPRGFTREGEFTLAVKVYAGPTMPIDKWTLPPFPPVATYEATFTVSGEVTPPEEVWEMVEEILGIVVEPSAEVSVWEMVEEVAGIFVEPSAEVSAWEMVEEIAGIFIEPGVEVAAWEMVEEIADIFIESSAAPEFLWVTLKNPPSGATKWQMSVVNDGMTFIRHWGVDAHNNLGIQAFFDIPLDWFPLWVIISVDQEWEEADGWHARELYRVQSIWSDRADYKNIPLESLGAYYFNVATEQFEKS